MTRSVYALLAAVPLLCSTACRKRTFQEGGDVQESFNAFNNPAAFGIPPDALRWETSLSFSQGKRSHPWSDSFWPTYSRGILWRWSAAGSQTVSPFPRSLWEQWDQLQRASGVPRALAALSPAEKHDFLVHGFPLSREEMASLKAVHDAAASDGTLDTLVSLQGKLELLMKLNVEYSEMDRRRAAIDHTRVLGAIHRNGNLGELQRERDELTVRLDEVERRWVAAGEDYTKTTNAHHARLMPFLNASFNQVGKDRPLATKAPLVSVGWRYWLDNMAGEEGDWTWEGICHGWSPAALYEAPPRNAVLASYSGREVLFLEGDIRGLLSNLWARQSAPGTTKFAGLRCNSTYKDMKPENDRISDGRLCSDSEDLTCRYGRRIRIREFVPGSHFIYALTRQPNVWKRASILESPGEDFHRVEISWANGQKKHALLKYTAHCRDTNPAVFHAALVEHIGRKQRGFVFDLDKTYQVWNQPVFGYRFEVLPVPLSDGSVWQSREPIPIERVADGARVQVRAPGTRFLVQVLAQVDYGLENGPRAVFGPQGERGAAQLYAYSLELDAGKNIIGGEWGLLPGISIEDGMRKKLAMGNIPDFLWFEPEGVTPQDGPERRDIVKRIQACSQKTAPEGEFTLANGERVPFVRCAL